MTLASVFFIFMALPTLLVAYELVGLVARKHAPTAGKVVLLLASLVFYAWSASEYLPLLILLACGNYVFARILGAARHGRRALLALFVCVDVACLLYYKYFNFLGEQLASILPITFENVDIIQPLGISFLVFSLISYLVDVYRGTIQPDRSVLNVTLWATFFPKITQGPIARYGEMFGPNAPAFTGTIKLDNLAYGARRFVIGLAKKVMIADVLGTTADAIFTAQASTGVDTATAWIGIIAYTFQIFFDFSGYSDMAIGMAAMFGFRLNENFNYPYISKTVGEFWRRWHISLSTWLRDYLYFPLGGSRRGNVYVNLLIVFLVSGFWHGAAWHYILWGLWYGVFLIVDRIYRRYRDRLHLPVGVTWLFTMLVVVFGWVLFRADDMGQAASYALTMLGAGGASAQQFASSYYLDARTVTLFVVGAFLSTPVIRDLCAKHDGERWLESVRAVGIPVLFVLGIIWMVNSTYSPFLYAQY